MTEDYFFKEVINLSTGKSTFYLNYKRVSEHDFLQQELLCQINDFVYNGALTTSDKRFRRHQYYYTKYTPES